MSLALPKQNFVEEFKTIIRKGQAGNKNTKKEITIQGLLTSADLSNKQIKVKDKMSEQVYTIHVSNISLEESVLSFWAKSVFIKGITDKEGIIQLAEIKKVA